MLIAAADPTGDVVLLWDAARVLGLGREVAAAAADEQLLEIGAGVRFRHPLVRSTIYAAASSEQRRAVHSALAQVTDPQTDPDRRAWHRALAAPPDEEVASDLERSAGRAQSRGGLAAAAAFLQRSHALTPGPAAPSGPRPGGGPGEGPRGRLRRGASAAVRRGDRRDERAPTRPDRPAARTDRLGRRPGNGGTSATAQSCRTARAHRPRPWPGETYLDAWGAGMFVAQPGDINQLREVSDAARAAPAPSAPPHLPDLLLDGLSLLVSEGLATATPLLRRAADAFAWSNYRWKRVSSGGPGCGRRRHDLGLREHGCSNTSSVRARSQRRRPRAALFHSHRRRLHTVWRGTWTPQLR